MTQCLLTLGAIPATSADTPHYPEETEQERRGSVVAGGGGGAQCKGIFLPFLFPNDDVSCS